MSPVFINKFTCYEPSLLGSVHHLCNAIYKGGEGSRPSLTNHNCLRKIVQFRDEIKGLETPKSLLCTSYEPSLLSKIFKYFKLTWKITWHYFQTTPKVFLLPTILHFLIINVDKDEAKKPSRKVLKPHVMKEIHLTAVPLLFF